jgi:UDP-N-acetylmuramyl tripeptide synthase
VVLNADDPQIAFLARGLKAKVLFFGLNDPSSYLTEHDYATDSTYCLNCGGKLSYEGIYFSHLGNWYCGKCLEKKPTPTLSSWEYPLEGVYNRYNTLAAVLIGKTLSIEDETIKNALRNFKPAFGRLEEIEINGKKLKILLSKNPTGFNESLRTAISNNPKTIILALNDRIPDGRDISWIWDVDFEMIPDDTRIIITGDRAFDLGLRLKYARWQPKNGKSQRQKSNIRIHENTTEAIKVGLEEIAKGETLYILPTYSAMLEIRKVIGGRKIL